MLKRGSHGDAVTELQQFLMAQGINVGEIDGDFGPATEGAVKRFQKRNALDADGICGPLTTAKMDEIRGGNADDETLSGDTPGIPKF
jgi:peptidoglycan hydrolase-like protein with peptidoglycan-binding domain